MLAPAAKAKAPPPVAAGAGAAAGAGGAAAAPPPLPVMLPQGRLPQPTVFDGTTPPFQEWIQEIRNFLSINNYEFIRQMDLALQSDVEVTLRDVTDSTAIGAERRNALTVNETVQDDLYRELELPLNERADPGRTDDAINAEIEVFRTAHIPLQRTYDEWKDRLERGGDYLNYMLIHGTKMGTEANNYIRRLQRSTNGFEALRLMRLRFSGGHMLQNYQLLRDILNPKFTESQQHFQYRQWLEALSRYELEAQQQLDDNLKIAPLLLPLLLCGGRPFLHHRCLSLCLLQCDGFLPAPALHLLALVRPVWLRPLLASAGAERPSAAPASPAAPRSRTRHHLATWLCAACGLPVGPAVRSPT